MKALKRWEIAVFCFLFSMLTAGVALADPPGRVARLQYMSGSVSVQPHGTDEWVQGTLNRPLTDSDNIWADKDSRAELNVGTGVLRMDADSSLTLTNINDQTVQVQLHQGTLNLHVRHLYDGEVYEIDTPNMAFTVQKSGDYRFDVDPDNDMSVVTVWKGEGDATGEGPSVRVRSGEQARFRNGTSLAHSLERAPGLDGFDDWCRVRDQRLDRAESGRYVSRDVIGYEDLDDYGYWRTISPYGPVWVPTVAPGWAPYRFGHWVWISPWGWTWVDDAPWGFAPFHYGRWVYYSGFWGWAPGPIYARPIWAPALVAWFGGPGWGVSLGFGFGGGYGWCPLGWGEPFFPWYGVSRGYFRNVNIRNTRIVNITNVTNNFFGGRGHLPPVHYANLRVPGGRTAVSRDVLINSRSVGRAAVRVPENNWNRSHGLSRVPLEPTRDSRLGIHAGQRASSPPARVMDRPTVSRLRPPMNQGRGAANDRNLAGRGQGPGARMANPRTLAENSGARRGPDGRSDRANQIDRSPRGGRQAVPRPPSAGGEGRRFAGPASEQRGRPGAGPNARFVPRPPDRGTIASNRGNAGGPSEVRRGMGDGVRSAPRSIPRPSEGGMRPGRPDSVRPDTMRNGGGRPSNPGREARPMQRSVPRPVGPVRPARDQAMVDRGSRSSGSGPSYSRGGSWDSPRYGRSESSPRVYRDTPGYGRSDSSPRVYRDSPRSGGYDRSYGRPQGSYSSPGARGGYSYGGRSMGGSPSFGGRSSGYSRGGGGYRSNSGGHSSQPRGRF
jgi:uncharacterized protein DUF6600/FecR-like protein